MLYTNSDTVALLERDGFAISIDSFSVSCAAIVVEPLNDALAVLTSWVDLGDEAVDGFCCVVTEEMGKLFKVNVHGKFEVNTESDIAASNIGIVGGSGIPGGRLRPGPAPRQRAVSLAEHPGVREVGLC